MMMVQVSSASPPSAVTEDSISLYTGYCFSHGSVTYVSVCSAPPLLWSLMGTRLVAPRTCRGAVPAGRPVVNSGAGLGGGGAGGGGALGGAPDRRAVGQP